MFDIVILRPEIFEKKIRPTVFAAGGIIIPESGDFYH
jgi:hypothetical protein